MKSSQHHRLFIRKLKQFQYRIVIAVCPLPKLKPLNYDNFIVNEQNICVLTLFFPMFPFDPPENRGIKREHWKEKR